MAWVKQLDHKLKFVMMPDCPRILSMGKLVKEQRLAFHWVPDQRLYLQNCKTGEIAWLEVECDTPVMPNHLKFIEQNRENWSQIRVFDIDLPEAPLSSPNT